MSRNGGIEARRTPRRVFERPVGVLWRGEYGILRALELSEGGILFATNSKIPIHSLVAVTVLLPDGHSVVAKGEIIYEQPGEKMMYRYGVKFDSLPLHRRRLIRNYVAAKTQEEAEREKIEVHSAS